MSALLPGTPHSHSSTLTQPLQSLFLSVCQMPLLVWTLLLATTTLFPPMSSISGVSSPHCPSAADPLLGFVPYSSAGGASFSVSHFTAPSEGIVDALAPPGAVVDPVNRAGFASNEVPSDTPVSQPGHFFTIYRLDSAPSRGIEHASMTSISEPASTSLILASEEEQAGHISSTLPTALRPPVPDRPNDLPSSSRLPPVQVGGPASSHLLEVAILGTVSSGIRCSVFVGDQQKPAFHPKPC
ncbi:hypothetical protein GYMLUDRAFT_252384 [Collybiopsis luxurians FD-317 M1]|uniref:Unplaced genomic scaffold GYMLUscaffold_125, whole genome shotgun sequence n=1 Tax=Collybiopsis luxurians FD-317 M1 TaxID=944289 RepID=A0A0D0BNL2_9AGAR|nr:hypothetical protein GYMLUDRAFT_252384 [Collybiopsis luxurians FD-317 M1]